MKSAEHGNAAAHLKHSIAYICNEVKTENGSLVGGINCLPEFAYEQMYEITRRFAEEFLGGEYEGVFSVTMVLVKRRQPNCLMSQKTNSTKHRID